MTPRVAVLDDEPRMAEVLAMVLRKDGYEVLTFNRPDAFLAASEETTFDLLLTDLQMPGLSGVEVLARVRERDGALPVILLTAHASIATAVEAMKLGASDYLEKPFENDQVRAVVRRALERTRLERENRVLRAELRERHSIDGIVTVSERMEAVLDLARRAARGRASVLITGESGTGKEVFARAIHAYSDRVGRPFVAVNLTAFAEGVLDSELFGHAKGAFTGAERTRPGLFERAHGGTVFLDEIGEVDEALQAKLLRVLQEREVLPVGGDKPVPVDVRVVAATNQDLQAEIAAGRFREDLFYRLAVIPIELPPLRERRPDVLVLARHFLGRMNDEMGRGIRGFTAAAEARLAAHDWPGNVRELENAIERAVVLGRGDEIDEADLGLAPAARRAAAALEDDADDLPLHEMLDRTAARHIQRALERAGGVRIDAAKALGVERTTLYRLMKKYGIPG